MVVAATRQLVLPVEHLEAELSAAPFASIAAFESCLVALDPCLRGHTATLWREQEPEILQRFPGISIDELIIRRDRTWFQDATLPPDRARPLLDVLRAATIGMSRAFSISTASAGLDRSDVEERRRWRWTTFALPVDLLLASVHHPDEAAEVTTHSLRTMLADRGVAESHLHLKASMEFPQLWASLLRAIAQPEARATMLAGPAAQFGEGRNLAVWLIRAAIGRLALGVFLTLPAWHTRGFALYLRERAIPGVVTELGAPCASIFHRSLRELGAGRLSRQPPSFELVRHVYSSLIGRVRGGAATGAGAAALDPLAPWFPPGAQAHTEFRFLRAAFDYLESPAGRADAPFARLFWQAQRLRVFFYRHIVQRPMIPGLQWFTRTYDRLSAPRRPIGIATFVESAIQLAGPGLRSLEVRMAPHSNLSDLRSDVVAIDGYVRGRHPALEVGIVYHFIRTRGPEAQQGAPQPWGRHSHDDPGSRMRNPAGCRFSGYYLERRAEAAALANLLTTYPRMLERVRGLDLCTDELGVPLWVMLPLIGHVRRAGEDAVRALRGSRHPVRPLRLTVHAGEDFVHLLGSIRRIGEAYDFLDLREGDRIGHGVALGVNVAHWASRAVGLAIPRGERLFDLMWTWRTIMRADADALRPWLPWIAQEACRVACDIFGEDASANVLNRFVLNLHSTVDLARAGFPGGSGRTRRVTPASRAPTGPTRQADQFVDSWLRDRRVFERAYALEPIDVARETPLVQALQDHVRTLLARAGIVVEINPSSNLLIGNLGDLTDHPLWRLCPPGADQSGSTRVRVCIGSDDPITFATRLPEEYQLLADAMTEAGLAMHQVDAWLERARAAGMNTRFTVPRSPVASLTSPMRLQRLPLPL